jgi:two-component sensor histidine kinase
MHELIENSIKYSDEYIHIKSIKKNKLLYIVIANDIGKSKSGSGFGLSLVKYISSKNRWHFETKVTDNQFQAALVLKL